MNFRSHIWNGEGPGNLECLSEGQRKAFCIKRGQGGRPLPGGRVLGSATENKESGLVCSGAEGAEDRQTGGSTVRALYIHLETPQHFPGNPASAA